MKQKKRNGGQHNASSQASDELGVSPAAKGHQALMHADQHGDGGEHGCDLNDTDHGGRQYAGICFDRKASVVAAEMIFLARATASGIKVPERHFIDALSRMVFSPPSASAVDALAFATTARTLADAVAQSRPEDLAMAYVQCLIIRTVEALEAHTGQSAEQFDSKAVADNWRPTPCSTTSAQ